MLSYNSVEVSPVKDLILMYVQFGFAFDLSYWFNKLGCCLFRRSRLHIPSFSTGNLCAYFVLQLKKHADFGH